MLRLELLSARAGLRRRNCSNRRGASSPASVAPTPCNVLHCATSALLHSLTGAASRRVSVKPERLWRETQARPQIAKINAYRARLFPAPRTQCGRRGPLRRSRLCQCHSLKKLNCPTVTPVAAVCRSWYGGGRAAPHPRRSCDAVLSSLSVDCCCLHWPCSAAGCGHRLKKIPAKSEQQQTHTDKARAANTRGRSRSTRRRGEEGAPRIRTTVPLCRHSAPGTLLAD
jgi:hypothetical protein